MIQLFSMRRLGIASLLLVSIVIGTRSMAAGDAKGKSKVTVTEFGKIQKHEYPWGWIRWTLNAEHDPDAEMTFGVVYIKAHQENALHMHPNCAEYLHVIKGSCEHLVGEIWVTMKAGDTVRIPVTVPHRARTRDQSCRAVIVYNTGRRQMVEIKEEKER